MTSNGHAWPIQNFMTFESNRNGRFESTSRSFALQVLRYIFYGFFLFVCSVYRRDEIGPRTEARGSPHNS